MISPDPLATLIDLERLTEQRLLAANRSEVARHSGVAWAGLSPPRLAPRTEAELREAAEARLQFQNSWRESPQGAVLAAICRIQHACEAAHAAAERARSAAARGLTPHTGPCSDALAEVRAQTADLLAGLRTARRAAARAPSPLPPG